MSNTVKTVYSEHKEEVVSVKTAFRDCIFYLLGNRS